MCAGGVRSSARAVWRGGAEQRRYDMCDVIHVRRQLLNAQRRIARRNIVELQSLSRSFSEYRTTIPSEF